MPHKRIVVFFAALASLAAPAIRAEEFKQVQVASTQRVNFAPGGLIRVDKSFGEMTVEAWDQPQVEVTVIKSMPFDYAPKHPDQAAQHLEAVNIDMERRSDTELAIVTTLPARKHRYADILPAKTSGSVRLEYLIHVPRNSRLAIHHGAGTVTVNDVTGDIDATVGRGDIMVWLSPDSFEKGLYAIDAKVKLGRVSSELDGGTASQYLFGEHFARLNPPSPSYRLTLRMGFGGITILGNKPETEGTQEVIH